MPGSAAPIGGMYLPDLCRSGPPPSPAHGESGDRHVEERMTLPGYRTYSPPSPPRRSTLARASRVLGIVGLVGLVFCLAGMIPALVGVVLGTISLLRRDADRRPAIVGVVCSALALVIGAVALVWLLSKAAECGDETRYPDDSSRRNCVEREFPFAKSRSTTTP